MQTVPNLSLIIDSLWAYLPFHQPFLFGAVGLAALFLFASMGRRGSGLRVVDYRAKPLLTRWEMAALREIRADLPPGFYACPQVRLADLVELVELEPTLRRAALYRVASKSVDFAITDPLGRVALVIELDDRTHLRPDRRERDQLVNAVLRQCGILILRVRPGQRVNVGAALAASLDAGSVRALAT